jgi:UDP-glucose 4-epimerase
MAPPSYLITGGAGYLAACLIRELGREPVKIRRMFRHGRTPPPVGDTRAVIDDFIGDVTERADVERALEGIDVVFHLASQTSVYVAEADPEADLRSNVLPLLHVLETCRKQGNRRAVFFAGTATEVGIAPQIPVDESFPDRPRTVYDVHKLVAERYLIHYAEGGFVRGATLRLANVYGPGPKSSRPDRGIINIMVQRALSGQPLTIYGTGAFMRDYVYISDVARAFALAAERVDAVNGKYFVIGSGNGHTVVAAVRLVAELVAERTGRDVRVEHVEPPASLSVIETRNFVARSDAFRIATGWSASVSLREGLEKTITYFEATS